MLRKIASGWKKRLRPVPIAGRLGLAASTVHAVLVRCRLNRVSHVDRSTGEPSRRHEHDHPGSLLHEDVKNVGNIPDGGGHRYVGRAQGACWSVIGRSGLLRAEAEREGRPSQS